MRSPAQKSMGVMNGRGHMPQVPVKKENLRKMKVAVVVADDDPLVRGAVSLILAEGKMEVAGEATNGEEAVEMVLRLRPQVLLLDLSMPGKAGLEALRELKDAVTTMRTIVLTVAIDKKQILEALQLGARGIVLKEAARSCLAPAIRAVMEGKYWVDRKTMENVQSVVQELVRAIAQQRSKRDLLSPKEMQVVRYIVEGCTNKDIAKMLETSEQVVKNHLGKIFDKLGVFNRLELALYALDNEMVER